MGSLGNPKSWVPYLNNKDCSQGFCSLYCPQWCYIIYPPPPPPPALFVRSSSLSPLVVAVIGVFVSAVLLVTYYGIISKYCASADRRGSPSSAGTADESRSDYADGEPWRTEVPAGLDEAAISTIAVLKYRRGEGAIEGTDCSVCLSEFDEGESVRLLPKCSHAFHVLCIDTWLRSHSNCPLCRAGVFALSTVPVEIVLGNGPAADAGEGDSSSGINHGAENGADGSSRALSDLEGRHITIEVKDVTRRRSVSVDFTQGSRVSLADILQTNDEEEEEDEEDCIDLEECSVERAGCSKFVTKKVKDHRKKVSRCMSSPIAMKRSVSSGRFFLRKNPVIPL